MRFHRYFLPILTASLLAAGCFRQVHRTILVQVPQLQGAECANVIQEALLRLDGVTSATPDFENRTMAIQYDSEKLAIRNIEFVISGAGFDANDIPANAEARQKLPAGCR